MWTLLFLTACSSYPAFVDADAALTSSAFVTVTEEDDFTLFEPEQVGREIGVVFYPGGLVDPNAYAVPLRQLAENGVRIALVPMPSDLAVLAPRKARHVLEAFPDTDWVIAGHSLGGAMAASFADRDEPQIVGLAMWAAYPAGNKDLSASGLSVLSITASNDEVLDWDTFEDRKANLPTETVFFDIEGGNHAGFGTYGPQDDDGEATIEAAIQQEQTVGAMLTQLDSLEAE
jgi:pimeloyl-ACP methyl ester carboxylesterase